MLHIGITEVFGRTGRSLVSVSGRTRAIRDDQGALVLGQDFGEIFLVSGKVNGRGDPALRHDIVPLASMTVTFLP